MDVRFDQPCSARSRRGWVAAGVAGLLLAASPVQAAWQLLAPESRVTATLTEITAEGRQPHTHHIDHLQGTLGTDGTLRLPLRLSQTDVMKRIGPLPAWLQEMATTPLVTVVTEFDPQRLDALKVGESLTDTLTLRIDGNGEPRRESLPVHFTRKSRDRIRLTNAEPVTLDGQALMDNSVARLVLQMLGYQRIDDAVPVALDAVLVDAPAGP
ncbi:hypothetical protein [Modicisalibacter sp. 'Wilcox']|uniref:hypothetical protein n=1 Tax=Modicisalibacter sp. 'Wilcox' TaxID=2679914 RepID=UPI0007947FA9|nr:hypothetical protein [Modicisalibacter sp. 'Wilcox']KXS39627.1 MAG: hypothetical protein AWU55_2 [Halomonadaceae bacterium T82-2]